MSTKMQEYSHFMCQTGKHSRVLYNKMMLINTCSSEEYKHKLSPGGYTSMDGDVPSLSPTFGGY